MTSFTDRFTKMWRDTTTIEGHNAQVGGPHPPAGKVAFTRRLVSRPRNPGEVARRPQAIINHCRECIGWDSAGEGSIAAVIRQCPSKECHLWPWRTGALDEGAFDE